MAASSSSSNIWSLHETKLFKKAIAERPELFKWGEWNEIAKLIPSKTAEEIKMHYEPLLEDLKIIEKYGLSLSLMEVYDLRYNQQRLEESIEDAAHDLVMLALSQRSGAGAEASSPKSEGDA